MMGQSARIFRRIVAFATFICLFQIAAAAQSAPDSHVPPPSPMATAGEPVDWLFVYKFNASNFETDPKVDKPVCLFPGEKPHPFTHFSQKYAYATNKAPTLVSGGGSVGTSDNDPLGATFSAIYDGNLHYVVWNDQFYGLPRIPGCGKGNCGAPWGHSKGVVAWNEAGEGVFLQVTTPDWPGAGNARHPRKGDGNTLGCIASDNNILVGQHFFSLRLTEADLEKVLAALGNASVVTDVTNPQLVDNGGPEEVRRLVSLLGHKSPSTTVTDVVLSSGIRLIAKPSELHVPPWQLVSALLGGVDLRAATWWATPAIPSAGPGKPGCWDARIDPAATPGAVVNATHGWWNETSIGLRGGVGGNHGKFGVATTAGVNLTIFGDENQQGSLSGNCLSSQNRRGGLFFVIDNATLHETVTALVTDHTAP
ncbi:MAG: hypothetical protein JWR80_6160 [Bradyrhizobium sp.]|nr:hypothetical protein [Bradyrhizobium sp.]